MNIFSHSIALVQLVICINAASIINRLDSLIDYAENDVNYHCSEVDPEQVFECFSSTEVQEAILLGSSSEVVNPNAKAIEDCHICDELPVIFLQNAIGTN